MIQRGIKNALHHQVLRWMPDQIISLSGGQLSLQPILLPLPIE
jgi:hypothetical protein